MVGETVGSYRIVRPLSQGAFGQVFLAQHTLIGRQAAVKVLHPEMSRSQEAVARFFNEARAAAMIRHPGLVDVFDFGHHPSGPAFLVMELLQGESLGSRLARAGGSLPEGLAIGIARQVAAATGAAHDAGIVHRDLKPDNLFLVPDPALPDGVRVKVLDFGIAKLVGGEGMKTRSHVVMGTAAYMSPEQCSNAAAVDRRADVYSLGCILYEMVCGRPPFAGESLAHFIFAHVQQAPPPPRTLVPSLRPGLDGLILRMLAKDPAARPQTMAEVAAALDALSSGSQPALSQSVPPTIAPSVPPTVLPAAPPPLPSPALPTLLRHPRGRALLAGAAALLGVLLLWRLLGPPPKVRLAIQSTPLGADVIRAADGVRLGQTPLVHEVARTAGQVDFLLRRTGYQDARLSLASDRDREAQVQLTPLPPPPPPPAPRPKPVRPATRHGGSNVQFHINLPGGVPMPVPGGFRVPHR